MNRRGFVATGVGLAGALLTATRLPASGRGPQLGINGDRLLRHHRGLAEIGRTTAGGARRLAFSQADQAARAYVTELMRGAGLDPTVDVAGNVIGRRAGSDAELRPLMVGSHIDSVPEGGNFDGPVGVIAGIEVAQSMEEQRLRTRHPLEVVVFTNEEGGKTGSRALIGEVAARELQLVTASGLTIGDGLRAVGGDPDRLDGARRSPGDIAAFLELHVEQGSVLDTQNVDIGVVEGIVGIKRWSVAIDGFANHAGTTPMDQRRDALVAAGELVVTIHRGVKELPGRQVATVGRIDAQPGAPNVIPGRVDLSLEIRDLDMEKIDVIFGEIRTAADRIAGETNTAIAFDQFYESRSAPTDERMRDIVERAARELSLSTLRMPSGAGHDAQSIAQLAPVGMIFVPSVGGISHSPKEFSWPRDVLNGANVLLHSLLNVDARNWS